jgi:hypothetical protein
MTGERPRPPRLPPRWLLRSFWAADRAYYGLTGRRRGLPPEA